MKIKCNLEEKEKYLNIIKENKELPEGITHIYLETTDSHLFYKEIDDNYNKDKEKDVTFDDNNNISYIHENNNENDLLKHQSKVSENIVRDPNDHSYNLLLELISKQNKEINEQNKKQTELLNTIKNCQLFFVVLTIIAILPTIIVIIIVLFLRIALFLQ